MERYYSVGFKQKVIAEIEAGAISADGARLKYKIGGKMTVYRWLRQSKKGQLIRETLSSMPKQKDALSQQKEKNALLESALADAQLKILALESLVSVASEHYGEDIKKNFGRKALKRRKRKVKPISES